MTHVKALQAGHSSQGTSEPITPALKLVQVHDKNNNSCVIGLGYQTQASTQLPFLF